MSPHRRRTGHSSRSPALSPSSWTLDDRARPATRIGLRRALVMRAHARGQRTGQTAGGAEADGNRTRQGRLPPLNSFEDCGVHQDAYASPSRWRAETYLIRSPPGFGVLNLPRSSTDQPQRARTGARTAAARRQRTSWGPDVAASTDEHDGPLPLKRRRADYEVWQASLPAKLVNEATTTCSGFGLGGSPGRTLNGAASSFHQRGHNAATRRPRRLVSPRKPPASRPVRSHVESSTPTGRSIPALHRARARHRSGAATTAAACLARRCTRRRTQGCSAGCCGRCPRNAAAADRSARSLAAGSPRS